MKYKKNLLVLVCLCVSVLLTSCGGSAKTTGKITSAGSVDAASDPSVSVEATNSDLLEVITAIKKDEGLEGDFIVEETASGKDELKKTEESAIKPSFDITINIDKNLDSRLAYSYSVNDDGSLSFVFTNAMVELTLPADWSGKVNVYGKGMWIAFGHEETYDAYIKNYGFEGGMLFSFTVSDEEPYYGSAKKFASGDPSYDYYLITPSDDQSYFEDDLLVTDYYDMYEAVDSVLASAKALNGTKKSDVNVTKDDKKKKTAKSISDKSITVTQSDASKVTYESYKDPSGYFTMEIPKGWKVVTGNDTIHYYICAYDPKDTDRRVVVQMLLEGFNNNFVNEYYQTYYGYNPGYLVISDTTTKGVFAAMSGQEGLDSHTYYTGFSYVDTIGKLDSGADLIQATAYTDGGNKIEMLCTAYVQVISDTSGLGVNAVYANGVCMLTAKEEEFPDWFSVLDKTIGTLSFTNSYWTQRNREWSSIQQSAQNVSKKWNSVSNSIMSSWEKRSNTHDIMMQEQSDATLGYDRVLDTETGKIYKAETGFIDGYSGNRYKAVESGSNLYNEPVEGYINYK